MIYERVETAKQQALSGQPLTEEQIIRLLEIDPESEEAKALGAAALEVAKKYSGGKAHLWGAIGVDYKPCKMNCKFCSLGEKWGIVNEEKEFTLEEIILKVKYYVDHGFYYILLRTTEFYDPKKLGEIMKKIHEAIPGNYILGCNIGELDNEMAEYLYECGGKLAYHCLRLREGIDTDFNTADRINTLEAIRDSQLKLGFWVEPIGSEHTNEEIAKKCLETISYHTDVCGVMARVPVQGTPFADSPQISEKRLAQITAVLRLACQGNAADICTHPASELAVQYGANVITLETGAIPRDADFSEGYWEGLHVDEAKYWLQKYGYLIEA